MKTRLARDIGAGEALRIYRALLLRQVRLLRRDPRFELILSVTPDDAVRARGGWPAGIVLIPQGRGDLGRRMLDCLRRMRTRPAAVIGSDLPGLTAAHVVSALRQLGSHHIVLAPARDGGFWFIGARHAQRLQSRQLSGVRWSTASALKDTVERLGAVHVATDLMLNDLDDAGDLRAARASGNLREA